MSTTEHVSWFGVRAVYQFGKKADGTRLFEERICVFSGTTAEEALDKALAESKRYAAENDLIRHPVIESYEQDGDTLIDGCEVWSEIYEYDGDLVSFVKAKYKTFEYTPDP